MRTFKRLISIFLLLSMIFTSNAFFTFADGSNKEGESVTIVSDTTTIVSDEEESTSDMKVEEEGSVAKTDAVNSEVTNKEETTVSDDTDKESVEATTETAVETSEAKTEEETSDKVTKDSTEEKIDETTSTEEIVESSDEDTNVDGESESNVSAEKDTTFGSPRAGEEVISLGSTHVIDSSWWLNENIDQQKITKIIIEKTSYVLNAKVKWNMDDEGLVGSINSKNELMISCPPEDIIKVEDANGLFYGFESVVEIEGLGNLDTSETENMDSMFRAMPKLEKLDFENLDVSNAKSTRLMFYGDKSLKEVDFSNFKSNNKINGWLMFAYSGFQKVDFKGNASFYKTEDMFDYCADLKEVSFANSDTSELHYMYQTFMACDNLLTIDFTNCDLSNVWERDDIFCESPKIKTMIFDGVKFMEDANQFFNGLKEVETISLKNADFSSTTCIRGFFKNCRKLKKIDLSYLDLSKIKDADSFIYQCYSLEELDMSGCDLMNFRSTTYSIGLLTVDQYGYVRSLNKQGIATIKLNDVKLEYATFLRRMFSFGDIANYVKHLEMNNVVLPEDCTGLFRDLPALETISLKNVDTSSVRLMQDMFMGDKSLKKIDLSSFDTSNVIYFERMFNGCESLESIDLSNFDTSEASTMSSMFENCASLKSIDLSYLDMSKMTMANRVFAGCTKLKDIKMMKSNRFISVNQMFENCKELEKLDLSDMVLTKHCAVTDMFKNCFNLITLDMSSFDITEAKDIDLSTLTNLQKLTVSESLSKSLKDMNISTGWYLQGETNVPVDFASEGFTQIGVATYVKTGGVPVDFVVGDGTYIAPVYVNIGDKINFSEYIGRSKRDGYTLEGFYADDTYETRLTDGYEVYKPVIAYAKWVVINYKVNFVFNNDMAFWKGATPSNITRLGAESYKLPTAEDLTNDGWVFTGWYDNWKLQNDPWTEIPANTFEDKIFYADWKRRRYKISFELNGGEFQPEDFFIHDGPPTEYIYNYGDPIPMEVKGPNEGEYLAAWYLDPEFKSEPIVKYLPDGQTGDIVLYACYKKRHKIVFDPDNDSITQQYAYKTSEQYFFEEDDVYLNGIMYKSSLNLWKFLNWKDKDGNVYEDKAHIGHRTEDLYLYGVWEYIGVETIERVQRTGGAGKGTSGGSSGGSSGGGGGGGGGGKAIPQNDNKPLLPNEGLPGYVPLESLDKLPDGYVEPVPTTTNISDSGVSIKQTIYANDADVNWVYNPVDNSWSFEKAGQKASAGFYKITRTDDYLINGAYLPVYYDQSVYYFDNSGKMVTGWVNDASGSTYFFENAQGISQGMMLLGLQKIQGDIYYFDLMSGRMAKNTSIGGNYFGPDGKLVKNQQ